MSTNHKVRIVHHGDEANLLHIARVSSDQTNTDPALIGYLMRNKHWSPFEMIGACVEIETTRDIGRQILRHRSFSFQEFSQRYSDVENVGINREMRVKGGTNRQGSSRVRSPSMEALAERVRDTAFSAYQQMLDLGIAPECARAILPEGFAPTKMYMNGTLRSWLHYLAERLHIDPKHGNPVAQREHFELAQSIRGLLAPVFPVTFAALEAPST